MPFSLITWLGLLMVGGFVVWKFIIVPILNEGKPIDPPERKDGPESKDTFDDISVNSEDIIGPGFDPFRPI